MDRTAERSNDLGVSGVRLLVELVDLPGVMPVWTVPQVGAATVYPISAELATWGVRGQPAGPPPLGAGGPGGAIGIPAVRLVAA